MHHFYPSPINTRANSEPITLESRHHSISRGESIFLFRFLRSAGRAGYSKWASMFSSLAILGFPAPTRSAITDTSTIDAPASNYQQLCETVGVLCNPLKKLYWDIAGHFSFEAWIPYLLAFGAAYLILILDGLRRRESSILSGLKYLYPKEIYTHQSAVVDYKLYVARTILAPLISLVSVVISSAIVADLTVRTMTRLFGSVQLFEVSWVSSLFYTLLLFLIVDFGFFLIHYLAHRVAILWEFHKVHHSAEVLTPVTKSRMHPIDDVMGLVALGISVGVFNGIYSYLGYGAVDPMTIPGTVILLLVFRATTVLKHSHIWLHYGRFSLLFSSPAMHQIHHSTRMRHRDKNLGRILSVWDWVFGTLYIPKHRESFPMGLDGEEGLDYRTVANCYLIPFSKATRLLRERGYRALLPVPIGSSAQRTCGATQPED